MRRLALLLNVQSVPVSCDTVASRTELVIGAAHANHRPGGIFINITCWRLVLRRRLTSLQRMAHTRTSPAIWPAT